MIKKFFITDHPFSQPTPHKLGSSPSHSPTPSRTTDTYVTAVNSTITSLQSSSINNGSTSSSPSVNDTTSDITISEKINTKFSDKNSLEIKFTSSAIGSHSTITTSDMTSSTLWEIPSIPDLQTELPTLFTVAVPSTIEPRRKRPRSSPIPQLPTTASTTSTQTGTTTMERSTQTRDVGVQTSPTKHDSSTNTMEKYDPPSNPQPTMDPMEQTNLATITEEVVVLSNTEMADDDIIPIARESPDRIVITKIDEDNTKKMTRDYFGGKPFTGQQKIINEKMPTAEALKKLPAEDMRKAAFFIFDFKENEETKYASKQSIVNFFRTAWNKPAPTQPSTFDINHNYSANNGINPKPIKINEQFTINPTTESGFKYLRVDILPNGLVKQVTYEDLKEMIEMVDRTSLNGIVKFKIIERNGLPKLLFRMENSGQTRAELRRMNGLYRKFARKVNMLRGDFPSDGLHLKNINDTE
ncbi:hypothetical protein SNEBB_011305 [Seison nebaliae]|nr:hypothetical protein SNEBB_011305 [Seison nebaliae]